MQSLSNGTQLGDYAIIRLIARGGMGEVYEAHDMRLDRRVALKVISEANPGEYDSVDLIDRFFQEARTLAKVNHPNVVTIHSIESIGDVQLIAMEYIEGVSLRQFLKQESLSVDMAVHLFEQMLQGLKVLHERRILHRDLKPNNILLRIDGQIKILDFGIAKPLDRDTVTNPGVVIGTPPYMAPELRRGKVATPQSDFWSLGAIFYECLMRSLLADSLVGSSLEFSNKALSTIPPELRAIIQGLNAPLQSDRYQSVDDILTDLRHFKQTIAPPSYEDLLELGEKVQKMVDAKRPKDAVEPPSQKAEGPEKLDLLIPVAPERAARRESPTGQSRVGRTSSVIGARATSTRAASARTSTAMRKRNTRRRSTGWLTYALGLAVAVVATAVYFVKKRKVPATSAPIIALAQVPRPVPATDQSSVAPVPPPVVDNSPLILKEPAHNQKLWLESNENPTLVWSKILKANEYSIELALDEGFKRIFVHEPVMGNSFLPQQLIREGVYHWRLVPESGAQGREVPPRSFLLSRLNPVRLLRPDAKFAVEAESDKGLVTDLEWTCKVAADGYRVQLSADPSFKSLILEKTMTECRWPQAQIPVGRFFWRVGIENLPGNRQVWSLPRQLTVIPLPRHLKAASPRPPAPKLKAPTLKEPKQVHVLDLRNGGRQVAAAEAFSKTITLAWTPVKGAHHYRVQIAVSKNFSETVWEQEIKGTSVSWRANAPDFFFWRVVASSERGVDGPASRAGQIQTLLPAPLLEKEYVFEATGEDGSDRSIDWVGIPLAPRYLVQWSPRRDFASLNKKVVARPKFTVPEGVGVQYVRVAAADASGEPMSRFSKVSAIKVSAKASLPVPMPLMPGMGLKAPARNGRISVEFSWKPVPKATSYTLEIANNPAFRSPLKQATVSASKVLLEQLPLNGRVYWRVRANGEPSSSPWCDYMFFEVN